MSTVLGILLSSLSYKFLTSFLLTLVFHLSSSISYLALLSYTISCHLSPLLFSNTLPFCFTHVLPCLFSSVLFVAFLSYCLSSVLFMIFILCISCPTVFPAYCCSSCTAYLATHFNPISVSKVRQWRVKGSIIGPISI
jgi:hypothetical protein